MYCRICGKEVNEQQEICLNCGCLVDGKSVDNQINKDDYYRKLSEYEKLSGAVWLVIGIIQVCSLVGIICGIWNIVVAISRLKYSNELLQKPENIAKDFEGQLTQIVVIMIINVFFGAIIGIIGSFVDLYVRSFVVDNKEIFG